MERGKPRCPISHPRFEEFRMLQFVNNIKIQTPRDDKMRTLTEEERKLVFPLFTRKTKTQFDFEDIAKKISGGKKGTYCYFRDNDEAPYRYNYKMTTSVSGNPISAALKELFGDDWLNEIYTLYIKGENKNEEQIFNDVWHALFFFDDTE